jgi:hypothetical protein
MRVLHKVAVRRSPIKSAFPPVSLLAPIALACMGLLSGAQIHGLVLNESRKPIANARVSVHRSSASRALTAEKTLSTGSDKTGGFTLDGVDPDDYLICVDVPGTDYLDSCKWGIAPPAAKVASAQAALSYNAVLTHGATISIRVDDPEELLPDPPVAGNTHFLMPGIWTKQATMQRVALVSSDKGGHDYSIVVPPDVDLRLSFTMGNLTLVDQKGYLLDAKASWDIRAKAGSAQKFRFRVTKPKG